MITKDTWPFCKANTHVCQFVILAALATKYLPYVQYMAYLIGQFTGDVPM